MICFQHSSQSVILLTCNTDHAIPLLKTCRSLPSNSESKPKPLPQNTQKHSSLPNSVSLVPHLLNLLQPLRPPYCPVLPQGQPSLPVMLFLKFPQASFKYYLNIEDFHDQLRPSLKLHSPLSPTLLLPHTFIFLHRTFYHLIECMFVSLLSI